MHYNRAHLMFWLVFVAVVGSALAAPPSDVFHEHLGVDRLVAVAALLGGFCAVTFAGSITMTTLGAIHSVARVIASGSVGIYCGSFAAPLIVQVAPKAGAVAPATAAFMVALAAPLLYGIIAKRLKKEK